MKNNTNEIYDDVSGYGITIKNNDLYLIKHGKTMKLSTLIIKERTNKREES